MPEFVLRFSGRFVFVEQPSDAGPVVQALAVDMTFNRDVAAAPHRVLMAAPRAMADHLGTRPPDLTLVPSPNAAIDQTNHERLEQVVWELAGLDLEIDRGTGEPFRWQDRSMLFDMRAVLGPAARLRDDVLGPGPAGGPVSATVRIAAGIGDARQIADRTSDFVRLNAPLGEPVLSGLTLSTTGFDAALGGQQSSASIFAMRLILAGGTLLFSLVSLWLVWRGQADKTMNLFINWQHRD